MNEVYVQRDANANIIGVYANPQPQPDGTCLTDPAPVAADDPQVLAFMAAHASH